MADTTVIRNIDWLVAYDAAAGGHVYRRGADLAFADGRITHVGAGYEGPAAHEIDGRERMIMPGLIDLHSHPLSEPLGKGFGEDVGNPKLGMSGLYDFMPVYGPESADDMAICAEVAYAELLLSGVTTLVDLSSPYDGWLDLLANSGLRGVAAPMFRSARWFTQDGHKVEYRWAEDGGKSSLASALETVDAALNHSNGRLSAMITPAQLDTCTPDLFAASRAAARERGIGLHIHAAQSLVEFAEITRRHGMSPIAWLDSLDLLGPGTVIAHAIFLDHHSWITWGESGDLARLGDSATHIAHCPNVFVRHGILLEHVNRYRAAGVGIGIGTDTFPHNMLEEMRLAALLARIPARHVAGASTADVFEAATLGGAAALGREDIGRIAPGACADLVAVDLDHPLMRPLRDPLRSLIFTAAERAVRDVWVAGEQVVREGQATTIDHVAAARRLEAARERAEARVAELDWGGLDHLEKSPLTLPLAGDRGAAND